MEELRPSHTRPELGAFSNPLLAFPQRNIAPSFTGTSEVRLTYV
ncbi:MAG: hypothetical protein AVDCRST_MAG58-3838 [uncultured Rubrobacteraceae bacterium]|uniref:Uncharacterized protein n=1 Tax=uncultured Rubrobacteraceae bacterium TaxID=349277 RepID=A0A6J4RG48_9ACTN|nr:MAG: hypothetical protein AVDCRST_MAG58-3838 [uncultured Rubrobacteraceae bacterium]